MLQFIIDGVLLGLGLCFLLGPIFIALTQTSIEKGGTAGMLVGLGVWVSDIIIILLSYLFIQAISKTVEEESFKLWLGIVGGIILMGFGVGSFFSKVDLEYQKRKHSYRNMFGFWLKGFLVNTINPFTFVFWIGVISAYIIARELDGQDAFIFLVSIMITIVVTDALKVLLAKVLRNRLKEKHIYWFSKVAGVGLFSFGIFLIAKILLG